VETCGDFQLHRGSLPAGLRKLHPEDQRGRRLVRDEHGVLCVLFGLCVVVRARIDEQRAFDVGPLLPLNFDLGNRPGDAQLRDLAGQLVRSRRRELGHCALTADFAARRLDQSPQGEAPLAGRTVLRGRLIHDDSDDYETHNEQ
jgi:hypothetical protein